MENKWGEGHGSNLKVKLLNCQPDQFQIIILLITIHSIDCVNYDATDSPQNTIKPKFENGHLRQKNPDPKVLEGKSTF